MTFAQAVLCELLGIHRWREEPVLQLEFKSGAKCYLDGDVCHRCQALRYPENIADVWATFANTGGKVTIHPSLDPEGGESK